VTDTATFNTHDADEEETGEDLGGLDDLLASLRSDEAPAPKKGRKPNGSGNHTTRKPALQIVKQLTLSKLEGCSHGRAPKSCKKGKTVNQIR